MQSAARSTVPVAGRYRWTRRQYEQMIEAGVFEEDARVELINGEVMAMSPQKSRHATAVTLLVDVLRSAYGEGFVVRPQLPLALDPDSEPEPDLAVVPGAPRDYRDAHPDTALLIVEVAEASLQTDRTLKAQLYARHGVPAYWILNVQDECLEVHRDPSGDVYGTKQTLHRGDTVTPYGTRVALQVAELLP